jgi:sortase A
MSKGGGSRTTATVPVEDLQPPQRAGVGTRLLRLVGWVLVIAGAVVLLYVVYALFFTNLHTDAAQSELRQEWELNVGSRGAEAQPDAPEEATADVSSEEPESAPDLGGAVALLEFVRPGSDERPVRDDPLLVVEGVSREALMRGPGHYPRSALPGEDGNFAVAGHRTTYGAPFFNLDDLGAGDEIHVTDRSGETHVYVFREQRVVGPRDSWVLAPDALGGDTPLLTLTTCHPRFSARQRLIIFAELVS